MAGLRLNLGCGARRLTGFVNVDKFGDPDVKHDLETFPWPWDSDSVDEIILLHVLEHLGQDPKVYLGIMQEMYRVCRGGARIFIVVPHFRHDFFWDDPTHVRAVTPLGLSLFSQRLNHEWIACGAANSPLGLYLGINFELLRTNYRPSSHWFRRHPEPTVNLESLLEESALYNNLIEQIEMELQVIKQPSASS